MPLALRRLLPRAPLFTAAGLALPLAACGGSTDDDRPSRAPATQIEAIDECAAHEQRIADGWELLPITDFEPRGVANPSLNPMASCQLAEPCAFYFNYDALHSATGPMVPGCPPGEAEVEPGAGPPSSARIPQGRCGESNFGFHLAAKNMATCLDSRTGRTGWGATLAVTFDALPTDSGQSNVPLDASEWDGLALWVRVGDQPSGSAVLTTLMDPYTGRPPYYDMSSPYEEYCQTLETAPDAQKCDQFGLAVAATRDWRFVKVPFSLVQQKGFGLPSPTGQLDTSVITGLQFVFSAGDWDFWIDDIALYREP